MWYQLQDARRRIEGSVARVMLKAMLISVALATATYLATFLNIGQTKPPIEQQQVFKKLYVKLDGLNAAGYGSWAAQLRVHAVLAQYLGAKLIEKKTISEHGYELSTALNARGTLLLPENPVICEAARLNFGDRSTIALLDAVAYGGLTQEQEDMLHSMYGGCDVIIDRSDLWINYDYARVTGQWLRSTGLNLNMASSGGIHIHIRWGDVAPGGSFHHELNDVRSMPMGEINNVIKKLRDCGVRDKIQIFMQNHQAERLAGADFEYTVVDTSDDIRDLNYLASGRFLLLSFSSYGPLACQLAKGATIIVDRRGEGGIGWSKAVERTNRLLYLDELNSTQCSDI
jgi:hypothetical protein